MTAQKEFNKTYITSSEIVARLGISRTSLFNAKKKGELPDPIEVENSNITLWKRADIEPYLKAWDKKRKERIGVV